MRRLFFLVGMIASIASAPAWGENEDMMNEIGDGMHFECVSGKLQATRGQKFNANVVPFDDPIKVCGAIIRPKVPGFFGSPPTPLARGCGIATPGMPFQLDTGLTSDNAVEAYARLHIWVPKRLPLPCKTCPVYQTVEIKRPLECQEPRCECKAGDAACLCLTDQWCPAPKPPPMPPMAPMVPGAAIFRLGSDNHINDGTNATTDILCRPAMKRARKVWTEAVDKVTE